MIERNTTSLPSTIDQGSALYSDVVIIEVDGSSGWPNDVSWMGYAHGLHGDDYVRHGYVDSRAQVNGPGSPLLPEIDSMRGENVQYVIGCTQDPSGQPRPNILKPGEVISGERVTSAASIRLKKAIGDAGLNSLFVWTHANGSIPDGFRGEVESHYKQYGDGSVGEVGALCGDGRGTAVNLQVVKHLILSHADAISAGNEPEQLWLELFTGRAFRHLQLMFGAVAIRKIASGIGPPSHPYVKPGLSFTLAAVNPREFVPLMESELKSGELTYAQERHRQHALNFMLSK